MPYIPRNARSAAERSPINKAELTYALTALVHAYVDAKGQTFDTMADAVAALECSKLEFYRTVQGPYEDTKRMANGSISDLDKLRQTYQELFEEAKKKAEKAFPTAGRSLNADPSGPPA